MKIDEYIDKNKQKGPISSQPASRWFHTPPGLRSHPQNGGRFGANGVSVAAGRGREQGTFHHPTSDHLGVMIGSSQPSYRAWEVLELLSTELFVAQGG